MATPSNPIKFFDIAPGPPRRTYAPNPWKTRYALNYKKVAYQTEWVEFKDIEATRKKHNVPPVRKYPNGKDFYTLPFIHDAANDTYVGDTLDIALYLDEKYPDSGPRLIPENSVGMLRVFNAHVDALFTPNSGLGAQSLPFNPETEKADKDLFCQRWGIPGWESTYIVGDARAPALEKFKAELEEFAKMYRFDDGPFLEGKTLTYADLIVGGWLGMLKETLPEWDQLCEWQGGRWKRLHEALKPYAEIK